VRPAFLAALFVGFLVLVARLDAGDATPKAFEGHKGHVESIAFSSDGKRLVSGGSDATVRVWDLATGKETAKLEGHSGPVESVAFAPDGQTVASAGFDDLTIRIWDLGSSTEKRKLEVPATYTGDDGEHKNHLWQVAFSPDGTSIAVHSMDAIRLWPVTEGEPEKIDCPPAPLSFAPDGKSLFVDDGYVLRRWDLVEKKATTVREWQSYHGYSTLSRDGKLVVHQSGDAVRTNSPELSILDTASGKELQKLDASKGGDFTPPKGSKPPVVVAQGPPQFDKPAFSQDGKTLAVTKISGGAWSLVLYDVATGKERKKLAKGERGGVEGLTFSPDGKRLSAIEHRMVVEEPKGPGQIPIIMKKDDAVVVFDLGK
jgi:WD40 repeat protein